MEVALKMALQYFQLKGHTRTVIAGSDGAYHGDTFGAMSVSGRGLFTEPFGQSSFSKWNDCPTRGRKCGWSLSFAFAAARS